MATIYIAGGFYGDYKETIKRLLAGHRLLDPEEDPWGHFPGHYVGRDLDWIREANVVLAVQTPYPYLCGMAAEIGFAVGTTEANIMYDCSRSRAIDVIYVCLAPRVDSFLSGLARATFTSLEAACKFINERYNSGGQGA